MIVYPGFTGAVRVAVADTDQDGVGEVLTGTGVGSTAHVKRLTGALEVLDSFLLPDSRFAGGVFVG